MDNTEKMDSEEIKKLVKFKQDMTTKFTDDMHDCLRTICETIHDMNKFCHSPRQDDPHKLLLTGISFLADVSELWQKVNRLQELCEGGQLLLMDNNNAE